MIKNKTWQDKIKLLLETLEKDAVLRDFIGGHPAKERELIKNLGILNLSIEKKTGGENLSWSEILYIVRDIASVDSSIAHIFAFHFLQLMTIKLYGNDKQYRYYANLTIKHNLFWGNALNPNDKRVKGVIKNSKLILNGVKSYCSGSLGSDYLIFSAWDDELNNFWVGVTDSSRKGITINEDWDAFGQKQTDSGTVTFNNVEINKDELLLESSTKITLKQSIRTLMAQSILVNLYIGIAKGALNQAKKFLQQGKKAWFKSDAKLLIDDKFNQLKFANLYVMLKSSEISANLSLVEIDKILKQSSPITEEQRGNLAILVTEAKILAHQATMKITSEIFEILGASSTSKKLALDRFWRNARVHTLHDPIDYKLQELGCFLLTGKYPVPSSYS